MSKGLRVRKKLYGRTKESTGSGSLTPPAGADGAIQYNNGGVFGAFGNWDDMALRMILGGELIVNSQMEIRESGAHVLRKFQFRNWGGASIVSQFGNIDYNVFISDTYTDAVATILLFAQGIKTDGSVGLSKLISASFRKDGTADPVQIGANTDLVSKEDSGDTPTVSIGLGVAGSDNIRVSYDSGNADVYTWNFWAIIAFTKV